MNPGLFQSGEFLCFCVLLVLGSSIFLRSSREYRANALLCADLLLLGAVVLRIYNGGISSPKTETASSAIALSAFILAALAAVALLASFLTAPGKKGTLLWKELLLTLIPLWLGGLFSVVLQLDFSGTGALTLSLLLGWFLCLRDGEARMKDRARQIEQMHMTLLQEQMRPHFIFNSLTSIRALVTADPALAADGLDNFAGYLRKNLDALSTAQMIPFSKELEHIEQYVALEKLNPARSFEMVYDLAVIDFMVPALSIQPLVENAIRHGAAARPAGAEGEAMVILTTEQQGEAIRVTVEDNGPGFAPGATPEQKEHAAHGLENVRLRLESQCGGSLHTRSDESGSRIVVLIPQRRAEE